jgi:hypothetical protein
MQGAFKFGPRTEDREYTEKAVSRKQQAVGDPQKENIEQETCLPAGKNVEIIQT